MQVPSIFCLGSLHHPSWRAMKVFKSRFTSLLSALPRSPLWTGGCISFSLKISQLPITFSLSDTNRSPSFARFPPARSPGAASSQPAWSQAQAQLLRRWAELGGSEEPLHLFTPFSWLELARKGAQPVGGLWPLPVDFDPHMGDCSSKAPSKALFSSFLSCLKTPSSTAAFIKCHSSASADSGRHYSHVWPKSSSYVLVHP